ncbi:hypothetical protein LTR85_007160 [Meristemomyces frigidus]|nr:hypothetical protein LTR85_007160 [Meristemomyces frigidus]
MALIPQNTLMGLPDELLVEIVHHATKSRTTINTAALKHYRVKKQPSKPGKKRKLLAPLLANVQLWTIARQEFYEHNVFSLRVGRMQAVNGQMDATFKTYEDPVERSHIKHLRIDLPFTLAADWGAVGAEPAQGREYSTVLPGVARTYPNLRNLVVLMEHDASQGSSEIAMVNGVELEPHEAYAAEIRWSVVETIKALDDYDSPALVGRYLGLVQVADRKATEVVKIDGRDAEYCGDLAWQLMDLPRGELRLT